METPILHFIPEIVGVMASSPAGAICYGEHNENVIGKLYDKPYADLDKAMFNRTLDMYKHGYDSLFVVGEKTLDCMGTLLDGCDVLVSTPELPGQQLVSAALAKAVDINATKIVVLGGRSVYHAFEGKYDCFHHTRFESNSNNISGGAKLVNFEKLLRGPQTNAMIEGMYDVTKDIDLKEITVKTYVRRKF